MEPRRNHPDLSADERRAMLERLVIAEMFEQFLQARYPGQKRFSLEGGEALVPLLDALVEETARREVAEVVLGMAHRGRLNVLAHVLEKPYEMIFAEFEGAPLPDDILGDGDVKYHLGYSKDRQTRAGAEVHLSLTSNPSHLERSEEHTSELQSRLHIVCRLLLEKKNGDPKNLVVARCE